MKHILDTQKFLNMEFTLKYEKKALAGHEKLSTNQLFTLTLLRPMGYSIKFDTVQSGWSIVYIEGFQVIISKKNIIFLSLKIDFVLANSANPDEILPYAAFYLGLHCLP